MKTAVVSMSLIVLSSLGFLGMQAPSQRVVVLRGTTIIDVNSALTRPGVTVVIAGNRIAEVRPDGTDSVPPGAQIIDGTGKFLMPGLWDMHAHLFERRGATDIDMPLLVANGVTAVREMGSDCVAAATLGDCLAQRRTWQRRIEAGDLLGPRLVALSSWPVDGPRGLPKEVPDFFGAVTAEQGRQLARYFSDRKVDFIKIYGNIPRDGFWGLTDEARKLGLPVVGHEPLAVSAIEASNAGVKSFEHARVFLFNCFPGAAEFRGIDSNASPNRIWRRRMIDEYDPKICAEVFSTFVRNGIRYVPTHLTRKMDAFAHDPIYRRDPRSKYIPKATWKAWNDDADGMIAADRSPEGRKAMMDFYKKGLEITGEAHKAGVKVMVGTDNGDSYIFPGFAVHDEIQELVEAGLTPAEALKAATWNGAEFLGQTGISGSIEPGKRADLILLTANPLTDVRNTQKIAAVILNGRYLDRAALDRLVAGVETAAATR
jgi:hypothetical protein